VQGNAAGHSQCSAGALPVRSAGLAQGEREQARAKQHETGCGYCEESFGYEIIVTHDAPADRDAGPNLLKLSESFLLQRRPRTIALISVSEENAGADEAEKCCNCLDHRNCPWQPLHDRNDTRGRTVKRISSGAKNRNPTDDLEQHRVPEERRRPAISADRSSVARLPARALPSSRHIRECRAAAETPPADRPSNAACPRSSRPAFDRRRKPIALGTQGTEGPIRGPRNNSFGHNAIGLWLPLRAIKAGARRFRGDDGRGGLREIRQRRSTRSCRPWPARSKGPGGHRVRQAGR
jgi:hypothetical protein